MYTRLSTACNDLHALIRASNYFILRCMPLAEDIVTSRHRITAYSASTVTVNDSIYRQSLVMTASTMHCPWPVTSLQQLNPENLAPILESRPTVVLLGTGIRQLFPEPQIYALFGQQGIGLEVMDNGALCRTFNILVAEDRDVTAAIILTP
jgi:uncharacterized protein